jgi:hypothetical protein
MSPLFGHAEHPAIRRVLQLIGENKQALSKVVGDPSLTERQGSMYAGGLTNLCLLEEKILEELHEQTSP